MDENKTIAKTDVEIVGTATEESVENLKARIADLESANKTLKSDVEIWQRLYRDEKAKQEKQTDLTKALMAYVTEAL